MCNHTFVICAYKESPFLEECIKSLKKQTVKSEILLATSTPNDYIKELADRYGIEMQVNKGETGISGDWNFAISIAQTKYVTIAHQDDCYEPDYAKKVMEKMNSFKNPIICFTNYGELRDGKKVNKSGLLKVKRLLLTPMKIKPFQNRIFIRRRVLAFGNAICCPSVTYNMDNMPNRIFKTNFRSNVDWETWERLSKKKGAFAYCTEILMYHRIHDGSETSAVIGENLRSKEDYEMYIKFWPKFIAKFLTKKYASSEKYNDKNVK